jgi:3-dehydroquinate dehydratase-1
MNRREMLLMSSALLTSELFTGTASAALADVRAPMRTVKAKNVVIGEGRPKTIVPITGAIAEEVLGQATIIGASVDTDVVEFRVDFLDIAMEPAKLAALGKQLPALLNGKPIITTFRTKAEGGKKAITDAAYADLYSTLLRAGFTDLIDVEMFRDAAVVKKLVDEAHRAGAGVVMSSHDFSGTPAVSELVARMRKQQELGTDIVKIAVMPRDPADVLTLLSATYEMSSRYADRPLMTMSMAGNGVVSRLAGEIFGSSMCFGMIGHASAPGQVEVDRLASTLDLIHGALNKA